MSIRRPELPIDREFTVVRNEWARDGRISMRARGLLVQLLSHRPGWEVTIESLVRDNPEGRDAVRSAIRELEEYGYLVREKRRDGTKFAGMDYTIQDPSIPSVGFPDVGKADVGKPTHKEDYLPKDHLPEDQVQKHNTAPHGAATAAAVTGELDLVSEDTFDQWWSMYPVKVGKATARKAYRKAALRHGDLTGKLQAYLQHRARCEGQGWLPNIPHPTTWLNQERWDDRPIPTTDSSRPTAEQRFRQTLAMGQQLMATQTQGELE